MAPRHLNIFLSSPGDVADERTYARQIIDEELAKKPAFRGKFTFDAVSWDDPNAPVPLEATITPQAEVNRQLPRPSACGIVILWARMGTSLPKEFGCTTEEEQRFLVDRGIDAIGFRFRGACWSPAMSAVRKVGSRTPTDVVDPTRSLGK